MRRAVAASAVSVTVLGCLTSLSSAQTIVESLDGTVFPADAGWSYFAVGNSVPSNVAFLMGKGLIRQRTMGFGYAGQGGNGWNKLISVPHASPFTLKARVRVLASEQWSFPFGTYFAFGQTGIALMSNLISPYAWTWVSTPFDATQWHDYRMEVTACGAWTCFVDGVVFTQGTGAQTSGDLLLAFGDGTGGANADADYDSLSLTVNLGDGADFNGDGAVDAADLAILLGQWGLPGITDLNCSGSTDAGDLAVLLGQWG